MKPIASMTDTSTFWGDATRSSHSTAAVRELASFSRVADLLFDRGGRGAPSEVHHVVVAPDGGGAGHVIVTGLDGVLVFDSTGARTGALEIYPRYVAATRDSFFVGTKQVSWSGGVGFELYVPGTVGAIRAMHLIDERALLINQEPILGNGASRQSARLDIVSARAVAGPRSDNITKPGGGLTLLPDTEGVGAFARDGRIVVITTRGMLHVYQPRVDQKRALVVAHEGRLPFVPYEMSVVDGAIAALEPIGVPAIDEALGRGPYMTGGDIHRHFDAMEKNWKTRLHRVSLTGAELSNVTVPFEVLQPPVDGGGGRIYLLGRGFAAVEQGRVLWSHPSSSSMLATAFAGGELAIATGPELRIVHRDGSVRRSFRTAGEPIVAPPAIASDGSVWVATNTALYVAR